MKNIQLVENRGIAESEVRNAQIYAKESEETPQSKVQRLAKQKFLIKSLPQFTVSSSCDLYTNYMNTSG